jgi:hypothetical protein
VRRIRRALRPLAALLAPLVAASAGASPRASVVVAAPGRDAASRATLAREALQALDEVPGLTPLRTQVLREALVPRPSSADATAEAFALARSAPAIPDARAAVSVYARAMELAFSRLPQSEARRFVAEHGKAIALAYSRLGTPPDPEPAPLRRLRRWRDRTPAGATASCTLTVRPADARVYLDGWEVQGGTSRTVTHEPGTHDLHVERAGHEPRHVPIAIAPGCTLDLALTPLGPVEDVRELVARAGAAGDVDALARALTALGRRLDLALLFVVTPEDRGALVRLFDLESGTYAGASPLSATDRDTLSRAFRALLDLRSTGVALARKPRKKKPPQPGSEPLWKKWWVWTLVLGTAGAATGAVLIARQRGGDDGTLTLRLRRTP